MKRYEIVRSGLILALTVLLLFLAQFAIADYYEYDYFYTTDRMSREHRLAGDVDDWFERGNSTVTASPIFPDGIRLTAWASGYDEETFEFGIASAVYFFEIPRGVQFIEIKVRYKGEPREAYLDDYGKAAGRVWIRNLEKEREYNRYEEDNETLYGDTFILRANRRSETIKIPAVDHVDDGLLELHIVAQNGELIDVNYIDVMTYRRQPKTRIVQYTGYYDWEPWYNYTYTYFYAGPHYYVTDYGYYVRWSYPIYDRHYIIVRRNYRRYLDRYRRRHGVITHHYYRPDEDVSTHFYDRDRAQTRKHLTKWTERHQRVRHEYSRARYIKKRQNRAELETVQTRIRQTIEKHRREPVLMDREIQSIRVRLKRRRDRPETDEINRPNIRTRIYPRYQRPDAYKRHKRSSRIRTQSQEDQLIRIRRYRKTKSSKKRDETKIRRKQTPKSRRISSNRKKKKDAKKKDEDEDDEEEEKQNRRNRRKRRR